MRSDSTRRSWPSATILALVVGFGLAIVLPAGCDTAGLVGGECRNGFSECEGICIDTSSDPNNCGGCGNTCSGGELCVSSVCTSGDAGPDVSVDGASDSGMDGGDGSSGDSGEDAAGDSGDSGADGGDSGSDGGDGGDGGGADGGDGGATDGGADAGDADPCVPPFDTPAQCGDCNTACPPSARICAPADGGFSCVPFCDPPLVECSGQCVDILTDPDHCNGCGNFCPSRICSGGACVGATVGHVVLMCYDFSFSFDASMQTRILANSVFLPARNPVRILSWEQFADPAVLTRVNAALAAAALQKGRAFTLTSVADSADIPVQLSVVDHEVLLVPDQAMAPAGALGVAGTAIAAAVDSFTRSGGTVVMLSSGSGEMGAFATNAGLFAVDAEVDATGTQLFNRAPADAVGISVLSPFLALPDSCTFTTTTSPDLTNVFVITDAAPDAGQGGPSVVHRVVLP